MRAIVIGSGVNGLTCAIRLRESGYDARIVARDLPERTVSSVAAAIWYPYNANPKERMLEWGGHTYRVLSELAGLPETGVLLHEGYEIFGAAAPDPWWAAAVPGVRRITAAELPKGYVDGFVFTVPTIEMPLYLRYLWQRFAALGGTVEQRALRSTAEALDLADLVVDCAGLGARELVGDASLYPIRGQVVRVAQIGLDHFWLDDYGPEGIAYIIPRTNDIILGGTADEGAEDVTPDPAVAAAIVARCAALVPQLATAPILEHKVGLRPGRPAVRLEAEHPASKTLIHCYGHGGAGVTLSWGCAEEVLRLAQ